jgi:hypothetical protein
MKSIVSASGDMEVLLDVPDHRELIEQRKREVEGFETVYHNWERQGHGEPKVHMFVFKKKPTAQG